MTDVEAARWLGEKFIQLDDACWCAPQEVGWYAAAAKALQAALRHGLIAEADFAGTDVALLNRVRASDLPEIQRWLTLLKPEVDFVRDKDAPDLIALPKVRAVDPGVLVRGRVIPLSQLDSRFANYRESYITNKQGEWGLRILAYD